ncbi:transcriptional regulator, luxR family [Streptomyces noursei ATCC 11455]|uniref:helix-turn-helix transcriptional regulator n=1 Tax=Streptomyces noursei TaxID=1971 RepID=UPI00081C5764|nr:transcriptional regulator, luxR family [Streptomyces noursei ATCC 11455]
MLVGRELERDELGRLLDDARKGNSGTLVLRGPAGIGKSALLADVVQRAEPDVRVLRAVGVEGEVELPFAALHQLLLPLMPYVTRLPEPQAAALHGALGLATAFADPFLVALAVLTLLSDASEDVPLLLVVDDAHWLDAATADALTFVARRMERESAALVFAVRDGSRPFPAPGLRTLRVAPLTQREASDLLARHLPQAAPTVRERLLREADGNPLALMELPTTLRPEHVDGSAPLPEHLPLSERLHQIFRHRALSLPADHHRVLLLAAAESAGDLGTVLGAAGDTEAAMEVLSAAASQGLVHLDQQQVRFRHPLVRSALYQGAPLNDRRAAHLALADAVGRQDDRYVWHAAAAAVGTDDTVAELLAALAERTRRTGGVATATQMLCRAAALASDRRRRARWLVDAAECAWTAARTSEAEALLDRAETLTDDPALRARAARMRGAITHASSDPAVACRMLLDGARLVGESDPELAGELLVMAARSAWVAGAPARLTEIGDLIGRLHPGAADSGDGATAGDADGPAPANDDRAATAHRFSRHFHYLGSLAPGSSATAHPCPPDVPATRMSWLSPVHPRPWIWPPVFLPYLTGTTEEMLDAHQRTVDELRKVGAVGALPMSLAPLVALQLVTGQWPAAVSHAGEALTLADDTGQLGAASHLRAMLAWAAAARGDGDRCRALAEESLTLSVPRRITSAIALARWALGLQALAEGQPDRAARLLGEVAAPGAPAEHFMVGWLVLPDLVEAAVRAGEPAQARAALHRFEERAAPAHLPHLHAMWLRCRALLASSEDADDLFTEALEAPHPSTFDTGRTHLLYGEWLRRNRRIKSARDHLHQAETYLRMLGARPWVELARQELRAAGDRAPDQPAPEPSAEAGRLTSRELEIARLAAQGMSNRDIAARLFLSPRTVGYHLYKLFPKLGITSRIQLHGKSFG